MEKSIYIIAVLSDEIIEPVISTELQYQAQYILIGTIVNMFSINLGKINGNI